MSKPTETQITSYFDQIQALIRDHGWMIQGVFPTGDSEHDDLAPFEFAYTIGLAAKGFPELLMVGPYGDVGRLLNYVADMVLAGRTLRPAHGNEIYDSSLKFPLRVRGPIDDVAGGTPVHMARNYYAWAGTADPETITVYQVEWPDPAGRFADAGGEDDACSPQLPMRLITPS